MLEDPIWVDREQQDLTSLDWGARYYFSLRGVLLRVVKPLNGYKSLGHAYLSRWKLYTQSLSVAWHNMRVRVLESLTNSTKRLQSLEVQLKMGLASVDHWEIVDGFEATLPSKANPKMKKEYQRHVKKTMSIIAFNLEDNQLAHIGVIKDLARYGGPFATSTKCGVCRTFFTCKIYKVCGSGSWDIPYALYEPMRKNSIKGKDRDGDDYLTPSIVHISLCMCMCLCHLLFSSIVLQYPLLSYTHDILA